MHNRATIVIHLSVSSLNGLGAYFTENNLHFLLLALVLTKTSKALKFEVFWT